MLFSMVLPVYNVEQCIDACMKSLFDQPSHLISDIILVDDGSTDSSGLICDSYAQSNSKIYVIHKKNGGAYQARIDGTKCAEGDYVLFIDPDDMLLENSLLRLEQMIQEYEEPDVLIFNYIVNGRINQHGVNNSLSNRILSGCEKYGIYEQLCDGDSINAIWRKCVKKTVLSNVKWQEEIYINNGEDIALSCQILDAAEKICLTSEPMYIYQRNPKSLTNLYSDSRYLSMKKAWIIKTKFSKKWDNEFATNCLEKSVDFDWTRICVSSIDALLRSNLSRKEKKKELEKLYDDEYFLKGIYSDKIKTNTFLEKCLSRIAKLKYRVVAFKLYIVTIKIMRLRRKLLSDR